VTSARDAAGVEKKRKDKSATRSLAWQAFFTHTRRNNSVTVKQEKNR
jgi:hypothetical protein